MISRGFNFDLVLIFGLAIGILILTIVMRFAFKLQHDEILEKLMKKYKLRWAFHFHHAFFGVILMIFAYYTSSPFLGDVGIGILLSDLLYHYLVLWPIVGSPDFTIIIKNIKKFEAQQRKERRLLRRFIKHVEHSW